MLGSGRKRENYGRGSHEMEDSEALFLADPREIVARLRETLESPNYEPPMVPAIALQLSQITADPSVSFAKVDNLIQSEPLLAAKVLRTAQSAFYSRGSAITSLGDAMTRLGLRTLSDLFLQAALSSKVFRVPGYDAPIEAIRKHSVVTAAAAREACRQIGFPDEYAYMCGLLHDVGMAACIRILADVPRATKPPDFDLVVGSIAEVHAEASGTLARIWNLPSDVQLVLASHHNFTVDGVAHPLAAAICVADWAASTVGAPAADGVREVQAQRAAAQLGLTDPQLDTVLAVARKTLDAD